MSFATNPLETGLTLLALLIGAALAGWAVFLERRPKHSFKPDLVPTTPVMFLGLMIAMFAIVHAVNLMGVHTGR
jgi:hypothetical protein